MDIAGNGGRGQWFRYSLIGGGDRLSNLEPAGVGNGRISDGFNRNWDLGGGVAANRTALSANSGLWPNVIRFTLAESVPVPAGGSFTAPLYFQSGTNAAGNVELRILLDPDFNPYNGNEITIDQRLLPNTGTTAVAFTLLEANVNPVTVMPGTYTVWARLSDGVRTRHLSAPQRLVITPSQQPPAIDGSSLTLSGGSMRFNVLAFPGQNITILASTDFFVWVPLQTHTFTGTVWEFVDADAGTFTRRFYRAVLTP